MNGHPTAASCRSETDIRARCQLVRDDGDDDGRCTTCSPGNYLDNGKCKQCRSCSTGQFSDRTCDGTGTTNPNCISCTTGCPRAPGWSTNCSGSSRIRTFEDACVEPDPCEGYAVGDSDECLILLVDIDVAQPCTLSTISQACPAACETCTAAPTSSPTPSPTTSSPTSSPTTSSPTVAPTASPTVTPVVCVQPGGGSGFGQDTADGVKKGGRFVRSISSDSNASASPAIVVGSTIFGVVVGAVATIMFRSVRRETVADRV